MTKPYEQHLLFELINSTVADVSRKECIDYHCVDNLITHHITPEEAKEKMFEWIEAVTKSELNCFYQFIKALVNYQEQICNYFMVRNTSGFVDGFNNKVKILKRRCPGHIFQIPKLVSTFRFKRIKFFLQLCI